jgi:hypothetical protein
MEYEEILEQMGLSDDESRELLGRLASVFKGLNEAQRNVFKATLPSLHEALESFVGDITEEQLLAFLEERQPPSGGVMMIVRGTHSEDDEDQDDQQQPGPSRGR